MPRRDKAELRVKASNLMRCNLTRLVTPFLTAGVVTCALGAALNPLLTPAAIAAAPPPGHHAATVVADQQKLTRVMTLYERNMIGKEPRKTRARPAPHVTAAVPLQPAVAYTPPPAAGILTEAQLGALWVANGGPVADEAAAECIAEAESSGNPDADNGADDLGLWQVYQGNDPGADLFNPEVNAAEAVRLFEADGWEPWTTAPGCGV